MLLGLAAKPYGDLGGADGVGIAVSLVSGLPKAGKMSRPEDIAPSQVSTRGPADRASPTDQATTEPITSSNPSDPRPNAHSAIPMATQSTPVGRSGGGGAQGAQAAATGGDTAAGGDPTAMGDILAQIARCLPPGVLPKLDVSRIVLEIGEDGALKAAPYVDSSLPRMTAEARLAADQVVQVALTTRPISRTG